MDVLDDIWITLTPNEVVECDPAAAGVDLSAVLAAFHQARRAQAAFELREPQASPLPSGLAPQGAVAVALTLGPEVDRLPDLPGREACLKAGLAQLEAYVNYRLTRRLAAKKLYLGQVVVPGGALAPDLSPAQVLDLLPGNPLGLQVEGEAFRPAWSMAYLYPVTSRADQPFPSACAACHKDCALRRQTG
jgi:hypothetical protein